jgi:hypothetical protein
MPLTINAPDIERRLQQEATRQGVSPAELAMHLLEAQLPSAVSLPAETAPFHSTASLPEWKRVFLEWVLELTRKCGQLQKRDCNHRSDYGSSKPISQTQAIQQ